MSIKVSYLTKEQTAKVHEKPVLGYILVGAREDSSLYVKMKKKACEEIGIEYIGYDLPDNSSQEEIEKAVDDLNNNPKVNGILV